MAKKQKRNISSGARTERPAGETVPAYRPGSRTLNVEFNPDYSPVISDLKKIGVLAVTFIGVLVVLSFFLR